ncbi:RIO1-domain-containing protein [Obba rivulosa]|uniref:Serine/threonine-protein kinase RIO1 n=1 Tax=Obba rivulosa TaxID=1052685 RepID=A0A8E2AZS7_9APHY|nr:RIO1-domain-containing protein [Obba rivulosa]
MSAHMTHEDAIEEGQFDDAPAEDLEPAQNSTNPREGHSFIDDEHLLEWSSESEEEDAFDAEEDELEAESFNVLRAEDEDWEIAERDFTKQYNRLRQHVAVRTGAAHSVTSSIDTRTTVAPLPAINRPRAVPKAASTSTRTTERAKDRTEDQLQALSKFSSRLRNVDMPYDLGVGINRKGPSATANMKDKSDRATSEQVLDPRTRIILFKMIGRGLIYEVNGCISTGKEANVYHAFTPEKNHLALKIYKTSILVFKDRDKYVTGEFRFRRGYSRHNPRKMVRLWAEKEMRNLKRMYTTGIRCPEPIEVRENVLVMSFLGDKEGWASPRLKDAEIPAAALPSLYIELLSMVRKMFLECKLVHADLSEYNILYHVDQPASTKPSAESTPANTVPSTQASADLHGHLYIIDVSQSVEHDHPHAFDFLRSDLRNLEDFFAKRGISCVGLRRAFEYVTRERLLPSDEGPEDVEAILRAWMEQPEPEELADSADGSSAGAGADAAHEDAVFMRSYIPRTLNEVYDPERDVGTLSRGEGEKLIYKDVIGIVEPKDTRHAERGENAEAQPAQTDIGNGKAKGVRFEEEEPSAPNEEDSEESSAESDEGDAEGSEGDTKFEQRKPRGHRHEDKEAKKVYSEMLVGGHTYRLAWTGTQENSEGRGTREAETQDSQGGEEKESQDHRTRTLSSELSYLRTAHRFELPPCSTIYLNAIWSNVATRLV